MLLKNAPLSPRRQDGFTLLELLITILIVTVGLLGLAKLQAAAVAESSMSRTRALMTFQAESLAGMMRANRTFWSTTAGPFPAFNVAADGTVTDTGMSAPSDATNGCITTSAVANTCSAAQLAHDDMYGWARNFNDPTAGQFPGATASITCVNAAGTTCAANPSVPNSYDIVLTWKEKYVAINRSTVNSGANSTPTATMVMHVQP